MILESALSRLWSLPASIISRLRRVGAGGGRSRDGRSELRLPAERIAQLKRLEKVIGVRFRDLRLLNQALAHRSYVYSDNLTGTYSNERMEFLGDAVLGLAVNDYLYRIHPDRREGYLTALKSLLVSKAVLARKARELDLGRYILLSTAERRDGGMKRTSILSDAFEALIGAIYLDRGLETAADFIVRHLASNVPALVKDAKNINYKSLLQEFAQDKLQAAPRYRVMKEEGPEHAKIFTVEVYINRRCLGAGTGNCKKTAEQNSARQALISLEQL